MRIVLTGASGLIGRALTLALAARGDEVIGVSRTPDHAGALHTWVAWEQIDGAIDGADAVVHLAGAGIAEKRWTARRKHELRTSRIDTARRVATAINGADHRPRVFVSASAVGYYGPGDAPLDETAPSGTGFLAELCTDWEAAAASEAARTTIVRFGVVLSCEGGALTKLLRPFRLGVGGPVGRGQQWMSWIHIDDAVGVLLHALDQPVEGALNGVAPNPVTNRVFAKALGRVLHRPALLPTPPLMLWLMLGEGASIVTQGQNVRPARTGESGYQFRHPEIDGALHALLDHHVA